MKVKCGRKTGLGLTPKLSPAVMSMSTSRSGSSSSSGRSVALRSRSLTPGMSESETSSGVEQFSLEELFSGKKNSKSTDAHNFLYVSYGVELYD